MMYVTMSVSDMFKTSGQGVADPPSHNITRLSHARKYASLVTMITMEVLENISKHKSSP